jgi:hypothetical protein
VRRDGLLRFGSQLLFENALAEEHAVVANVNARSLDEFFDFRVRFAAEAAESEVVGRSGHNLIYELRQAGRGMALF